jgi:hypothetical protein
MATKSKHRKNHKQKLQARKNRIQQEKASAQKQQREFLMNLIKQEQEKGLFDAPANGPIIDGPIIDGPILGGVNPITDGLITDVEVEEVQEVQEVQADEEKEK